MKIEISKCLGSVLVFGAALGAHAEGVSFYGLLDGGYASTSISGGSSTTEFITGGYAPTFVGATGSKDLGKGLTGGFNLEQGFLLNSPSSGSSRFNFGSGDTLFNRQANLFIKGNFGEIKAGTQINAAFNNAVLLGDARFGSGYGASLATIVLDGGMTTHDSGSLSYASPSWNGVSAVYQYVPQDNVNSGKTSGTRGGNRMSLSYEMGSLKASVAGYSTDRVDETVTRNGTVAAATYKIGSVDLKAIYALQKNTTYDALKTIGLGGAYFANADLTFDFGVFRSTDSATDYQSLSAGVGVQYALTKDVTAYFQYANVKNTGATTVSYNFVGDTQAGFTIDRGQIASTYNAGLMYAF